MKTICSTMFLGAALACASLLSSCDSAQRDWERAKQTNTVAAYESYTEKHANSPFAAQAIANSIELKWSAALVGSDASAIEGLINAHPNSNRLQEAVSRVKFLKLQAATASATASGFLEYLSTFDADDEAVAKMKDVLSKDDFGKIQAAMRLSFETDVSKVTTAGGAERVISRYSGLGFGEKAVPLAERLWLQEIQARGVQRRVVIPIPNDSSPAPRASFTVLDPNSVTDIREVKLELKPVRGGPSVTGTITSSPVAGRGREFALLSTEFDDDILFYKPNVSSEFAGTAFFALRQYYLSGRGRIYGRLPEVLLAAGSGSVVRFAGSHDLALGGVSRIASSGDKTRRLTFLRVPDIGLVHLRGIGRVEFADGRVMDVELPLPQDPAAEKNVSMTTKIR